MRRLWPVGPGVVKSYDVAWKPTAQRGLNRLPAKMVPNVVDFVFGPLAENPARVGHSMSLELDGLHSARVGVYRVVYRIDEPAHRVTVEAVGHRGDIYRRR